MNSRFLRIGLLLCALAASIPVFAAQRTFVASSGNDANTCTVSAPCRSFGTALIHTDTGGEVIVLDSAGYGPVTINKSVALIAPTGVYAGISVFASTPGRIGIVVNAGATGFVTLRGLSLVNLSAIDATGIYVTSAAHVRIESLTLDGFYTGIYSYANTARVAISDTAIRGSDLGTGVMGSGIAVQTSYDARLIVTRSVINNARTGIYVGGVHHVEITDTTIAYCEAAGVRAETYPGQPDNGSVILERVALLENNAGIEISAGVDATRQLVANVRNSTISGNQWGAWIADGGYLRLAGTQITANHTAIYKAAAGLLFSLRDNLCEGNDAPCIVATPITPY